MDNVLITGASGFLGSALVRQIALAGLSVRATDRREAIEIPGIECVCADILQPDTLKAALEGVDGVIHAAGLAHVFDKAAATPFKVVNEIGTLNVACAAAQAGVKHFILVSSVAVYGGSRAGGGEDSGCYPDGPYAESKYQAELRAIEIARSTGMSLTILRLATLYGEGDPGNVARLMRAIDRRRFVWVGDGSNRKSLLHREDAARACLTALRAPGADVNVYNISAPPCTMKEIVTGLAAVLGRPLPGWRFPAALALGLSRPLRTVRSTLEKWLADDVYDARKFEVTFGFRARVGLAEGLRREVEWYRGQETYKR
jgi:nucleoside-diphosphate-sugar epimerase